MEVARERPRRPRGRARRVHRENGGLSDEALGIFTAQGNAGAEALDLPPAARWFGATCARVG